MTVGNYQSEEKLSRAIVSGDGVIFYVTGSGCVAICIHIGNLLAVHQAGIV